MCGQHISKQAHAQALAPVLPVQAAEGECTRRRGAPLIPQSSHPSHQRVLLSAWIRPGPHSGAEALLHHEPCLRRQLCHARCVRHAWGGVDDWDKHGSLQSSGATNVVVVMKSTQRRHPLKEEDCGPSSIGYACMMCMRGFKGTCPCRTQCLHGLRAS